MSFTKKEQLLENAEQLFFAFGYKNTTISAIADSVDISDAGIYRHFNNKEDLLFTIAEKNFNKLISSLEVHFLGLIGADNKLRKFVWHYLYYMQENYEFTKLFITELWSNRKFYNSDNAASINKLVSLLENIIISGIDESHFDEHLNISLISSMVLGTINHMIMSRIMLDKPLNLLTKAEEMEKIIFRVVSKDFNIADASDNANDTGKRNLILKSALENFSSSGFQNATIANIAASAGITEPTIYQYFTGKDDILMHMTELGKSMFIENYSEDIVSSNPENILKLFIWNHLKSIDDFPEYTQIMIEELRTNAAFYQSEGYIYLRRYVHIFNNILTNGISDGIFRGDIERSLIIDLYYGTIDSILLKQIVNQKNTGKCRLQITNYVYHIYNLVYKAIKSTNESSMSKQIAVSVNNSVLSSFSSSLV